MSYQITKVDLIPNGEIIKCNASQFDNGRVLPFEIYENKVAYNIPNDVRVELHCRKPDGNIVTLSSDIITDNIVTFITTTQLTACYGDNVCEIALYGADDYLIGSANFILEVEKSPTYGGINSTSEIHNLESQIRDIAEDVIPEILPDYLDNYYTKSEVDALIDNIFPTFTASGAIASFITALTKPLVSVTAAEGATMVTRCGANLLPTIEPQTVTNLGLTVVIDDDDTITINGTSQANGSLVLAENVNGLFTMPSVLYLHLLNDFISSQIAFTFDYNDGTSDGPSFNTSNRIWLIPSANVGKKVIRIRLYFTNGLTLTNAKCRPMLSLSSTAIPYIEYNGQTVPVSEATTLVTQSGVNNVFADVGDVTVGYKYMPMPETENNSNRLLLSSVRSDIIKEKSEIEEQVDIIEDIERGDKNE